MPTLPENVLLPPEAGKASSIVVLCRVSSADCKHYWLFAAVAASILQPNGTASGFLVDPITGNQLVNSSGMMQALGLWRSLMAYNSPDIVGARCGLWEDLYVQGGCVFTLSYKQVGWCRTNGLTYDKVNAVRSITLH